MRTLFAALLAFAALAVPQPALGQYQVDLAPHRAALERLSGLVGVWEGEARVSGPHPMLVHQREEVRAGLDGTILIVHGRGFSTPERTGAPVFEAFAVLSYAPRTQAYEFRTYAFGHATTATAEFLPDGAFRWSTPAGPVQSRYTIWLTENTWREIGEISRDGGATWTQNIELNLHRIE
ncbi:MAG TPA: hypothetical protein VEA80_01675 [Vitreimonas sp.]|uniref:hypothetical protein n=1 Tax=Vitreimonas sp. TaxID=3069702 RepID=UPI002D54AE4B|nr:hypothetical protein [Vitreimonas sp.]HYD86159.1 hypothetical protein [Vitreimonas sp.]